MLQLLEIELGQLGFMSTSIGAVYINVHILMHLIWFLILLASVFLIFVKCSGDDNKSTWEHISQYIAQLGEASSSNALYIHLFSLSLTETTFSWFPLLPPNSIRSWNELEQKFYDHFYSGDKEAKLTDLTSVRQGRDESISNYCKRFKENKKPVL